MRYLKNNFTEAIEFKFFNSWAIKNQRYSEFVEKRYPSYDVPCPSYDGPPYPSYDGFALYHILNNLAYFQPHSNYTKYA